MGATTGMSTSTVVSLIAPAQTLLPVLKLWRVLQNQVRLTRLIRAGQSAGNRFHHVSSCVIMMTSWWPQIKFFKTESNIYRLYFILYTITNGYFSMFQSHTCLNWMYTGKRASHYSKLNIFPNLILFRGWENAVGLLNLISKCVMCHQVKCVIMRSRDNSDEPAGRSISNLSASMATGQKTWARCAVSPSGSSWALPPWQASLSSPLWQPSSCWAGVEPQKGGKLLTTLLLSFLTNFLLEEGKRRKNHRDQPDHQKWRKCQEGHKKEGVGLSSGIPFQGIQSPGISTRLRKGKREVDNKDWGEDLHWMTWTSDFWFLLKIICLASLAYQ